ncbi:hypothetical protein HK096_009875, partial [Nowakowskiella sp. JEL0078]
MEEQFTNATKEAQDMGIWQRIALLVADCLKKLVKPNAGMWKESRSKQRAGKQKEITPRFCRPASPHGWAEPPDAAVATGPSPPSMSKTMTEPQLEGLPTELLREIAKHLPCASTVELRLSCKQLYACLDETDCDPFHNTPNSLAYLEKAAIVGSVRVFRKFLAYPLLPLGFSFLYAIKNNHTALVLLLLSDKRVDPSDSSSIALHSAVKYNCSDIVRFLLADGRVDPTSVPGNVFKDFAICLGAELGHLQIVKILLADHRVDPS